MRTFIFQKTTKFGQYVVQAISNRNDQRTYEASFSPSTNLKGLFGDSYRNLPLVLTDKNCSAEDFCFDAIERHQRLCDALIKSEYAVK